MPLEPGEIRNVAVVGHRGTGRLLVEALLFHAGATNRLGPSRLLDGVNDWYDDEHRVSCPSASICNVEWQGRKITGSTRGDAVSRARQSLRCASSRVRSHGVP